MDVPEPSHAPWEKLWHTAFAVEPVPPWFMTATCREFTHPLDELQVLRRRTGLYCGDFELRLGIAPASAWREGLAGFAANCLRERWRLDAPTGRFRLVDAVPPPRPLEPLGAELPSPVEVLFDACNFGTFMWSWVELTERCAAAPWPHDRERVYGRTADGLEFLPRVFAEVPPRTTSSDVPAVRRRALSALAALPDLHGGVERAVVGEAIERDMAAVLRLCAAHGTFGDAVLPEAFEPVRERLTLHDDGNLKDLFLAAGQSFYALLFATS